MCNATCVHVAKPYCKQSTAVKQGQQANHKLSRLQATVAMQSPRSEQKLVAFGMPTISAALRYFCGYGYMPMG
jgi:hypothetical protein